MKELSAEPDSSGKLICFSAADTCLKKMYQRKNPSGSGPLREAEWVVANLNRQLKFDFKKKMQITELACHCSVGSPWTCSLLWKHQIYIIARLMMK
ncbi:hypothetical protein JOB18_025736 [Solea senegalensis]|uniref:Uncharacterized protein n=1 Tax=Solea senegalensis TaxID=28829 RepID=A0AAV6QUW4_SOLSE|nr:hypothetical protein JOB18_025736 [Solea senegalensis]